MMQGQTQKLVTTSRKVMSSVESDFYQILPFSPSSSHPAVQADGQVQARDQAGQEGEAEGARRRQVCLNETLYLDC